MEQRDPSRWGVLLSRGADRSIRTARDDGRAERPTASCCRRGGDRERTGRERTRERPNRSRTGGHGNRSSIEDGREHVLKGMRLTSRVTETVTRQAPAREVLVASRRGQFRDASPGRWHRGASPDRWPREGSVERLRPVSTSPREEEPPRAAPRSRSRVRWADLEPAREESRLQGRRPAGDDRGRD